MRAEPAPVERLGLPPLFVWLPIAGRSRTIHTPVKPRQLPPLDPAIQQEE